MEKNKTKQINERLREEIAVDLGIPAHALTANANLLTLGLDSMRLMAWMHRLRKRGHKIKLRDLYQQPTLRGWSRLLHECPVAIVAQTVSPTLPATASPTTSPTLPTMTDEMPFPLTPVQHAYLVGRAPHQTLGGIGCHLYQEFDGSELNADALEQAIGALIERHPMLTVVFTDDGCQQHHPHTHWRGLTLHDMQSAAPAVCETHLQEMREHNGHRVLAVEQGENVDFQLTLLPNGRHRLHVNIDLLVLDAASFSLMFDELAALIRGERLPPREKNYDFRSYLAQAAQENEAARQQAQQFWMARRDALPDTPQLPLACEPAQIKQVRITRQRVAIQTDDWARFTLRAAECGVTPTMALVTCFGAVLARWCHQPKLLLNLTIFDRQPLHPAVDAMIADFTNILLLDITGEGAHFDILAQANQQSFTDAHEHRHWSGVELLRELRKTPGAYPHGAPVVFTSNLGSPLFGQDVERTLGTPGWGISQTPQVWIDHLAYAQGNSVFLQWDSNQTLFPPGLLDVMFQTYVGLVHLLIAQPQAWHEALPDLMPQAQQDVREQVNAGEDSPRPQGLLHDGFWHQAQKHPNTVALIHDDRQLSYGELARQAQCCAGALVAHHVQPGDRVAISMSKGIGQIVAVLGILYAGAVYVPVSRDQPLTRQRTLFQSAGIGVVLVCHDDTQHEALNDVTLLTWQQAITHVPLAAPRPVQANSPAYIIYTSGSTGTPKGVVISHRGAMNTCAELNRRYAISTDDRVLALAALHFDLSVYDIFGLLTAGGALVLVDEGQRRDPAAWCSAIERYGVTLWNTVPALFDMLLTYSEGFERRAPARLRAVMLSGDWIGLGLPGRYRHFRPDGHFIAMGGATEASIWSNVYDVDKVSPAWRAIPYGYPLARQKFRVADTQGRDCPDWVPGELWIGGEGVALGYFDDPERTAQQFVLWEGERWYRTGDIGCYWPDGRLEFLGRRDKQVKVGGYRIELGEIEAALLKVDGVKSAVALAVGEREKSLVAFAVPQEEALLSALATDPLLPENYAALLPSTTLNIAQGEHATETDTAKLIAGFLYVHLRRQGVPLSTETPVQEVLEHYGAPPEQAGLITRWLDQLCAAGFLRHRAENRYAPVSPPPSPWQPAGGHPLSDVANVLSVHHEPLAQIVRGERSAQTLLNHPFWAPEPLLLRTPGMQSALETLASTVVLLAKALRRPVRLHEIGARSGLAAKHLLQRLNASTVEYTAWDASPEMVLRATDNLQRYAHASVRRWHDGVPHHAWHQADLVWANNALHRLGDRGIQAALALAAPSALVCVHELRQVSSLALVSAELLAESNPRGLAEHLHETRWWQTVLGQHGMHSEAEGITGDVQWLLLRAPIAVLRPDSTKLVAALRDLLSGYMVPQRVFFLDALPLTANGKVDHRALIQRCIQDGQPQESKMSITESRLPLGDTEQAIALLWRDLLNTHAIDRDSHFFQLGGDSLLATRLIGELGGKGYAAALGDLFDFPTLATFSATVRHDAARAGGSLAGEALRHDLANRYVPFPLTDVQQAYLVGRQPGFALGGVGSHFFVEFDVATLDVVRFEHTMNRLIQRHDALRMVVRDGMQQVLQNVPQFALPCHPLVSLNGDESTALRERLARQVRDPTCWPVFDIQMAHVPGSTEALLFVCFDNLMLDGLSMQILLAELIQLYRHPEQTLPELDISFRDYLEHMRHREVSAVSLAYWKRRLDNLPPAPRLPLRCDPAEIALPHFSRLSAQLSASQWKALKARARDEGLTPSALLLSAFATTLSSWADQKDLCLNLTLFDRQPLHPQIEQVLGDFTTLLLLAWQPMADWRSSAHRLQQRLRQDLLHRGISAIQVMRQLALCNGQSAASMPVVFTSALGFEKARFLAHDAWMKPRWGLSQTPQVWLDHQVYESEGELRFNWDYVQELFDPQQIKTLFERYAALLQRLAIDNAAWDMTLEELVPKLEGRYRASQTAVIRPVAPLNAPSLETSTLKADDPMTQMLCRHFEQVVGEPIQPLQSFFDAGATSLKLVQLHVHLTQHGHGDLQVTDLFAHPTPLALATHLHGTTGETGNTDDINDARRALLAQRKARAQWRRRGTL